MTGTLLKVGDDSYLLWSGPADAPASYLLTREQVRDELLDDDRRRHARSRQILAEHGDAEDLAIADAELALAERRVAQRLARADRNGTSDVHVHGPQTLEQLIGFNRAGPGESRLTPHALLRCHANADAAAAFTAGPDDIAPYWTNSWDDQGRDIYVWVPWRPGQAPERLDEHTDLRAQVPMSLDEVREIVGAQQAERIAAYT